MAWAIYGYRDVLELVRDGDEPVDENINPKELTSGA
jgi:hypothetical protein